MQCFENNNAYLNIQCTKLKHECTIFKIKIVCLFLETNLANLENGLGVSIMCFVYFENVLFYLENDFFILEHGFLISENLCCFLENHYVFLENVYVFFWKCVLFF